MEAAAAFLKQAQALYEENGAQGPVRAWSAEAQRTQYGLASRVNTEAFPFPQHSPSLCCQMLPSPCLCLPCRVRGANRARHHARALCCHKRR